MVWLLIHDELSDDEQQRVEFVFTDAPSELDQDEEMEAKPVPSVEGGK